MNGHKFKRQQPIGPCIVDFVCFEAKVVLELDGGQHADAEAEDRARDTWLRAQGFRVLRLWNNDVLQNLDGVLERIVENLAPSPRPSPTRGEGDDE
jgi:very-short-patch-repair endonuclease